MKQTTKILRIMLLAFIFLGGSSFAQDATVVDPDHYKVEFENDEVRVLRINYDPGEKSAMHSHPEGMVIFLSDANGKFTFPDSKTENRDFKKGFFGWVPATTHQGENVGDKPFEVIQIEMKTKKE